MNENETFVTLRLTPPLANVMKNTMYFSKKLDHFWGTFAKKKIVCPPEKSKHL